MISAPRGLENRGPLDAPQLFQAWGSDLPNLTPPILRIDRVSGPLFYRGAITRTSPLDSSSVERAFRRLFVSLIEADAMFNREIFIKDTHRSLWYEDGVLVRTLAAGRYEVPNSRPDRWYLRLFGLKRKP